MRSLLALSRFLDGLVAGVGKLGAWVTLPLIAIIIFDVVTRKFVPIQQAIMQSPFYEYISSTKLQEWEWHLHTVLFVLALGYAYVTNSHVRVDLVREKLPQRAQVVVELIGLCIFMLPYITLVLYFGWDFVMQAYTSNEVSSAMTGLSHRWIIKAFLLGGLLLALLAGISNLIKTLAYLFGPRELHSEIHLPMVEGLAGNNSSQGH